MQIINQVDLKRMLNIIERIPFFSNFSMQEKNRMVCLNSHFIIFQKGEYLIREGDQDSAFFILLTGTVSVVKGTSSYTIARLSSGDFFGEISFLTKTPRTATIIADDTVLVVKVNKEMLDSLGPSIRDKIKDSIIMRLAERIQRLNNILMITEFDSRGIRKEVKTAGNKNEESSQTQA